MTDLPPTESAQPPATRHPLFWPIMLFTLVFPSIATWLYFMVLSGSPAMGPVYSATKVLQFSVPALAVLFLFRQPIRMFAGGTRGTLAGIAFGIATSATILALYLGYLRGSALFELFGPRLTEKLEGFGATTPLRYALLALFISLFHSFLEEYYWRWFVFGELRKRIPLWLAYLVSSVGFAAHHVLVVLAYFGTQHWPWIIFFSIGVAVGGAVWSWLYSRSNSLFAPWISHLFVDVALLLVGAIHLYA